MSVSRQWVGRKAPRTASWSAIDYEHFFSGSEKMKKQKGVCLFSCIRGTRRTLYRRRPRSRLSRGNRASRQASGACRARCDDSLHRRTERAVILVYQLLDFRSQKNTRVFTGEFDPGVPPGWASPWNHELEMERSTPRPSKNWSSRKSWAKSPVADRCCDIFPANSWQLLQRMIETTRNVSLQP